MQSQNYTLYFVVVEIAWVLKRPSCTNDWGGPHARMAHLPADYVITKRITQRIGFSLITLTQFGKSRSVVR